MATAIKENLDSVDNDAIEKIDLSKAGNGPDEKSGFFLNITLKDSWIEQQIRNVYTSDKLQLNQQTTPANQEESKDANKKQRVLVDFSSPNIAKNMHVGHLRSTI